MTADEVYGQGYITLEGKLYSFDNKIKVKAPKNWILHYCYRENDGYSYLSVGPNRRFCVNMNSDYSFKDLNEIKDSSLELIGDKKIKSYLKEFIENKFISQEFSDDF